MKPTNKKVNEISDELRNRYVNRAVTAHGGNNMARRNTQPGTSDHEYFARKEKNNAKGISRALSDKRLGKVTEDDVMETKPQSMGTALKNSLSKVEPGSKLDNKIKAHNRAVKNGQAGTMKSAPDGYHIKKNGTIALGESDGGGTCSASIAAGPAQNLLAQPQKRVKEAKKRPVRQAWEDWDPWAYKNDEQGYYNALSQAILSFVSNKFGGMAWFKGGSYAYKIDATKPNQMIASDGSVVKVANVAKGLDDYCDRGILRDFADTDPMYWDEQFRPVKKQPTWSSDQEDHEVANMRGESRSAVLRGVRVAEGYFSDRDVVNKEKREAGRKAAAEKKKAEKEAEKKKQTNEGRNHLCGKFEKDGKKYHLWNDGEYQYSLTQNMGMDGPKKVHHWPDADMERVTAELQQRGYQDLSGDLGEGLGDTIKRGVKSFKRGMQGWGHLNDIPDDDPRLLPGAKDSPRQLVARNKGYDDATVKQLARPVKSSFPFGGDDTTSPHSPRGLQKRVLDREMKKRGLDFNAEHPNHITRAPTSHFAQRDEGLGDDMLSMVQGMKNKDGSPRFPNAKLRTGPQERKPESTIPITPRPAASHPGDASGPADWYDQSSGGKRYMGDSVEHVEEDYYTDRWAKEKAAQNRAIMKAQREEEKAAKKAAMPPKVTGPKRDSNGLTKDDYSIVWRKIEAVVGQIFPDGDPIDWLAPWLQKQGIRDYHVGEVLNKACKLNGYEDIYAYYNSFKTGDYGYEE